ncbi:MAG: sulfatase, partial [Bradymonadaceae bacterium]
LDTTILSQYMQKAGYKTGVVAANGYLSHLLNLNRGWDFYRNLIHEETAVGSSFLSRAGMQWALENKDEPFFLYLGTIDPHVTYRRHEEFIGLYDDDANYTGRFRRHMSGEDLGLVKARKLPLDDREKLRVINLYKNEITFNDSAFGYVREQLEEAGIWDQTMVVVTSDHGEEFWEHGSVGHGHNVHQEMVHVPMFFYYPPLIPAGTVVDAGADVIDIMATVLDIIGVDRPEGQQGKSVLPLIFNQHGGYPEPAVATQYMLHYAMQLEDWKIYMRRGEFRVYDRRTDILELEDVGDDHPLATRWLLDSMSWFRAHRARWDKHTWGVASNLSPEFLELLGGD